MTIEILKRLFRRDLEQLAKEISLYTNEENLWLREGHIANTAGNLCLHLVGNLNAFIGAVIGNTGYVRDRPLEFSDTGVPRATLLSLIADTANMIDDVLGQVDDSLLSGEYPIQVWENKESYGYFLIHLSTHLSYHLGQINYHRRLLDV